MFETGRNPAWKSMARLVSSDGGAYFVNKKNQKFALPRGSSCGLTKLRSSSPKATSAEHSATGRDRVKVSAAIVTTGSVLDARSSSEVTGSLPKNRVLTNSRRKTKRNQT